VQRCHQLRQTDLIKLECVRICPYVLLIQYVLSLTKQRVVQVGDLWRVLPAKELVLLQAHSDHERVFGLGDQVLLLLQLQGKLALEGGNLIEVRELLAVGLI
jgi:hypothetical protein